MGGVVRGGEVLVDVLFLFIVVEKGNSRVRTRRDEKFRVVT